MPLKIRTVMKKFSDIDLKFSFPDDSFEPIPFHFGIPSRKKTKIFNITKYH